MNVYRRVSVFALLCVFVTLLALPRDVESQTDHTSRDQIVINTQRLADIERRLVADETRIAVLEAGQQGQDVKLATVMVEYADLDAKLGAIIWLIGSIVLATFGKLAWDIIQFTRRPQRHHRDDDYFEAGE